MNNGKKYGILAVGTLMLLFIGLIYGWSIFGKFLGAEFPGWSKTQLSLPFTLSIVFFCIGGFVAGNLTKKIANRWVVLMAAVCLFVGFFLLSSVLDPADPNGSVVALDILYGVLNGFGVGFAYNAILSAVTPWFPGKTGLASGILLMGFGVGALVLGSVVSSLVAQMGIFRTFFVLGAMVAAVLAAGSFFVRKPAAGEVAAAYDADASGGGIASSPSAPRNDTDAGAARREYALGETVRTPTFWLFFLWNVLISAGGLLVIGSAAQIAETFGAAAVLGLIVSVFNGVGRPVMGSFYDALGRGRAMVINNVVMLAGGAALLLGAATGSALFVFIGLPLIGISYGGSPSLLSAGIAGFFGQKFYAVNFAAGMFCLAPAAVIGPTIASKLQESSGGAYGTTFTMLIVLAVVAFVVNLLLTVVARKSRME